MSPRSRLLRRLSLVLVLGWLTALGVSLARRQELRHPPVPQEPVETPPPVGTEKAVRVHSDFDYTDSIGLEPNFRVAAKETLEFASGWVELHDVEISFYRKGEVAYGLTASSARLNRGSGEAVARGAAQLSLGKGIALRSDGFALHGDRRTLDSLGPVTFAGPGWGGLAAEAHSSIAGDVFSLAGNVAISWRGTASGTATALLTPTLVYSRQRANLVAPESVTVLRGRTRLRATGAEVRLTGPEGRVSGLHLNGDVDAEGMLEDGSEVSASSGGVDLKEEGDSVLLAVHPAGATGWVTVEEREKGSGHWYRMSAWRAFGRGSREAWNWVEGQGLACLTEFFPDGPPREVTAARLNVSFENGRPDHGFADGDVEMSWGERGARGDHLTFSLKAGTFDLTPVAGGRVEMHGEGVEARSDHLSGGKAGGIIAEGDVAGELSQTGLWGSSARGTRFAAAAFESDGTGSTLVLRGNARLWQGDRLLHADRLTYDTATETVRGEGDVVVTTRESGSGGGETRVTARTVTYDRRTSLAVFEGSVRLTDERGDASAQRLVATLGPSGNVELATFDGGVIITEKATGRVVKAQRARLAGAEDVLDLWGSPVLVTEPSGNQIKGEHMRWFRATGNLTLAGGEENPSETLYHPPPTPRPGRGPGGGRP